MTFLDYCEWILWYVLGPLGFIEIIWLIWVFKKIKPVSWKLYLDDIRNPPNQTGPLYSQYIVLRSSAAAIEHVKVFGMPNMISFDHDLGGDDTSMVFLKWLANEYWDGKVESIPEYKVHSANPVGAANIISFMESWKRSCEI